MVLPLIKCWSYPIRNGMKMSRKGKNNSSDFLVSFMHTLLLLEPRAATSGEVMPSSQVLANSSIHSLCGKVSSTMEARTTWSYLQHSLISAAISCKKINPDVILQNDDDTGLWIHYTLSNASMVKDHIPRISLLLQVSLQSTQHVHYHFHHQTK